MGEKLFNSQCIFAFSKDSAPALVVSSGARVEIQTMDCFANQVQRAEDTLQAIDWDRINPATGPIFVESAQPGDVLKVTINGINLNHQGVMAAGKGLGVLGDYMEELNSKLIPIKDNKALFNSELEIPLNPMIGVIGVAPAEGDVNCGTPGSHGGNMDNAMITTGAVLYLPVFAPGALFALGDLHAAMGDGEIGVTGVEIAGVVDVTLEVIKGMKLDNPVLENKDCISTIASAALLDDAVKQSTVDMSKLLLKRLPMSVYDLTMLMSISGQAQICQVVDPLKTARFVMPKWILNKYNFSLV
jgi:amidase